MTKEDDQRSVGVYIGNAVNVTLSGSIQGFDVGVKAENASGLKIRNLRYQGAGQAFDIKASDASIIGTRIISEGDQRATSARIGYRKPNGPPLPAQCPDCKSIFPSIHYNLAVPNFTVKNNLETCPMCRKPNATLAEGVFECIGELVRVIEANEISLSMLRAIGAIAGEIASGKIDTKVGLKRIRDVSPHVAQIFRWMKKTAGPATFYILAAIGVFNTITDFNDKVGAAAIAVKIYEAMSNIVIDGRSVENSTSLPDIRLPILGPTPLQKPLNRHERRRSAKIERKP